MSNAGAIVAAARLRKERQLVSELRDQRALSAAAAVALDPKRLLGRSALRGLLRHGAVHQTPAGAYWLDEPAYEVMRTNRGRRAFILIGLAVVVVVAIMVAVSGFASRP